MYATSAHGRYDRTVERHTRRTPPLRRSHERSYNNKRPKYVQPSFSSPAPNTQPSPTVHVEEFKKELTREVLSMTQEVARLHRERQTLEQQIADLFAFYARQKNGGEQHKVGVQQRHRAPPPQQQHPQQQQQHPQQQQQQQQQYPPEPGRTAGGGAPPPSRGRRPLPSPQPRGMPGAL